MGFGTPPNRLLLGLVTLLISCQSAASAASLPNAEPSVRILFLTDCTMYSDWQSIAMVYSYIYSSHKGPITRVMCCSDEDRKNYNPELLELVETHIAPAMTVHPKTGDVYAAYNKPEAVIDYMAKVTPEEEWLLVLDSDMLVRVPWRVSDFNLTEGWAAGSRYDYMIGVNNPLADKHIPEIPKRNDTFAGPLGRRSDKVGGFFFIHRNDLKRLSTLWLKYTEDVREDPEAYKWTGDQYATKPGQKPWISEMYGYSYGAAKANVWHHWDEHSMLYPGYTPGGIPKVLHYGLEWEVEGVKFDKHYYSNFDPMKCPPWDLSSAHPQAGLFPHPPRPSELKVQVFMDRYRDLIAVEGIATLNAGLCHWYRKRCPDTEQLVKECDKAEQLFFETREALRTAEAVFDCIDFQPACEKWAKGGECKNNPSYMAYHCRAACALCTPLPEARYPDIFDALSHPKGVRMVPQPIPNPARKRGDTQVDAATHSEAISGSGQKVQQRTSKGDATEDNHPEATPASSPVPSPLPSPVPSPVPSPDPSPLPSPDPSPVDLLLGTPSPLQVVGGAGHRGVIHVIAGTHKIGAAVVGADLKEAEGPSKPLRELLKRCYRMGTLNIDEVKLCVAAAKEGIQWVRPQHATSDEVEDGVPAKDVPAADDLITSPAAASPAVAATTLPAATPAKATGLKTAFSWQMLLVWALLITFLAYTVPRFVNRRRARSGLRAE